MATTPRSPARRRTSSTYGRHQVTREYPSGVARPSKPLGPERRPERKEGPSAHSAKPGLTEPRSAKGQSPSRASHRALEGSTLFAVHGQTV